MKYLKMLGLAVTAAAVLTAILGAGSASASTLCTATETPCTKKDKFLHAVLEPGTSAYLIETGGTTSNPLVTCTESTVTAESEETGSSTETEKGIVKSLTFGGCNHTTNVLAGGTLEVHAIAGTDNGTVTSKEAKVTVSILGVSCTYGSGGGIDIGTLTGGTMATMDINTVVNRVEGSFLCPTTAVWEGSYTVTEPEPLYVEPS